MEQFALQTQVLGEAIAKVCDERDRQRGVSEVLARLVSRANGALLDVRDYFNGEMEGDRAWSSVEAAIKAIEEYTA